MTGRHACIDRVAVAPRRPSRRSMGVVRPFVVTRHWLIIVIASDLAGRPEVYILEAATWHILVLGRAYVRKQGSRKCSTTHTCNASAREKKSDQHSTRDAYVLAHACGPGGSSSCAVLWSREDETLPWDAWQGRSVSTLCHVRDDESLRGEAAVRCGPL